MLMAVLFAGKAISQGTSFIVFSEKGEQFTVYVNNDLKNSSPADYVRVDGLHGPTYKVKILFKDNAHPEIQKTIFSKPGKEMFYALRPGPKGPYILDATSSDEGHGKSTVKEETPPPPPPAETKKEEKKTEESSKSSAKSSKGGCDNPMSEPDFQSSVVMINNAPFENIRVSQTKKLVETHCLTCRQIVEAMYIVSGESNRLAIAKSAYTHCSDPGGYDEVKDALSSSKAKADLEKYISSVK
jgi:hypothetical protein